MHMLGDADCHTLEELLLKLSFCDFDLNGLVNLLCMSSLVIRVVLYRCREECVDECSLPKARFASDLIFVSITSTSRKHSSAP